MSSLSSHHPHEVFLAQFSLYVHKDGIKPHSFIKSIIHLFIHSCIHSFIHLFIHSLCGIRTFLICMQKVSCRGQSYSRWGNRRCKFDKMMGDSNSLMQFGYLFIAVWVFVYYSVGICLLQCGYLFIAVWVFAPTCRSERAWQIRTWVRLSLEIANTYQHELMDLLLVKCWPRSTSLDSCLAFLHGLQFASIPSKHKTLNQC